MSRAFVKEDAGGEDVMITHRAPLPAGVPNLVTPSGMAALEAERAALQAEQDDLRSGPESSEATRRLTALEEELELLAARLASATVVPPSEDAGQAGIGATLTVRYLKGPQAGQVVALRVVGVDEADPLEGRVAFTAPVAQALLGKHAGAQARFMAGDAEAEVLLEKVAYPAP